MPERTLARVADGLDLCLVASSTGLSAILFEMQDTAPGEHGGDGNPLLREAARQLRAYFAGSLREFDLPLDPAGTAFQKRVWSELVKIPYGQTRSYAQIAAAVRAPKAVRAVGAANGSNPLPIVVPCHRVIGSSGKLVGYGGGLALKRRLLDLEGSPAPLWR